MAKFFFSLLLLIACSLQSQEPKEKIIPTNDAKLFCRVFGEGKPIVVLHGGPGLSQDYLLPQMDQLAKNHLVIFYDQRGCGQSTGDITLDTINIQTFVDDLDAIRKAFHFEKISLLGHSWGGFVAMSYACAHPETVEKLILANTIPASSEEFALLLHQWSYRTTPYREELTTLQSSSKFHKGDPETVERYYNVLFSSYCYLPEKVQLLNLRLSPSAAVNGSKVFAMFQQNLLSQSFNIHPSLKRLTVPTLIVHGDADMIPPLAALTIHKDIAGSQYVLLTECGHFPYVESPDAFFKKVSDFLLN